MAQSFRKTLKLSDFTMASTVALVAGDWRELAYLQVPAQQLRQFGYGAIVNGVDDRGTFKLAVNTSSPAAISGSARLVVKDANRLTTSVILDDRSEVLASGTDLGDGVRLGASLPAAKEDSYLVIEYDPDSSATATSADSDALVPVTITAL